MAWVRFTQDYDFRVRQGVTRAYKAGMQLSVTARCAREAIALNRAERMKTPSKSELEAMVRNDGK